MNQNATNRSGQLEPVQKLHLNALLEGGQTRMDGLRASVERLELLVTRLFGDTAPPQQHVPQPVAAPGLMGTIEHMIDYEMRELAGRLAAVTDRLNEIA